MRLQLRRGITSLWTSRNPILAAGEPAVDLTTGVLKVGNGVTPWLTLNPPPVSTPGGAYIGGSLFLADQGVAPATPVGGAVIYVEAGSLKVKGSSGTVTILGPA